jgi:3-mercaptopyruvate sulfurtransferase SseA
MLKERGVKNVRALKGGWNEWVNEGYPVAKTDK